MGFTFVEPDLGAALHIGIKQPIDDKECTFDPSDFSKGDSKVMLTRMRGKLFQELAGRGVVARIGCQVLTQAFATTTDMLNAA